MLLKSARLSLSSHNSYGWTLYFSYTKSYLSKGHSKKDVTKFTTSQTTNTLLQNVNNWLSTVGLYHVQARLDVYNIFISAFPVQELDTVVP